MEQFHVLVVELRHVFDKNLFLNLDLFGDVQLDVLQMLWWLLLMQHLVLLLLYSRDRVLKCARNFLVVFVSSVVAEVVSVLVMLKLVIVMVVGSNSAQMLPDLLD